MTPTAPSSPSARGVTSPGPRPRIPIRLIGAIPLLLVGILYVTAPSFFGPQPELFGLPAKLVFMAGAGSWALIGLGLVWDARSWLIDVLGLLLFTIPAMLFLILGPAIILIIENLAAV